MARAKDTPDKPDAYRARWKGWVDDPLIAKAGITFDRTPSGPILAPKGRYRVCAYHIDFDERPTCWMDVDTLAEAKLVCEACAGWNVDYAVAYDDAGGWRWARPGMGERALVLRDAAFGGSSG